MFRFRNYRIEPDLSDAAPPVTFTMQCVECGEAGPVAETGDAASAWIVIHLRASPRHLRYRELIARPYRAVPEKWL